MESKDRIKKGEIMKAMQSFLMFFYILDQCYGLYPEDDLGSFLGAVSPELWGDGKPMDKAVYQDWQDRNQMDCLNDQNIVKAVLDFLSYYQEKFGLDFSRTKLMLQKHADNGLVRKAADKTEMMYQKYKYEE